LAVFENEELEMFRRVATLTLAILAGGTIGAMLGEWQSPFGRARRFAASRFERKDFERVRFEWYSQ
jgi:hypothetical protein